MSLENYQAEKKTRRPFEFNHPRLQKELSIAKAELEKYRVGWQKADKAVTATMKRCLVAWARNKDLKDKNKRI